MEEIVRIELKSYIREVVMSKKQNPRYYVYDNLKKCFNKKLPKKYSDPTKFATVKIGNKYLLVDHNLVPVIANPKTCGTPKTKVISGQAIWKAQTKSWDREKMMGAIKAQLSEAVKDLEPISTFPININCELHDYVEDPIINNQLWDLDNRFIMFQKAFLDVLTGNKKQIADKKGNKTVQATSKIIIPDDNILFVTQPPSVKFIPLLEGEERKIVFIISKETDERVLNHPKYKV